jgi:hypothetical protein
MRLPLVGLESTLAAEACERVELESTAEGRKVAFRRRGADVWTGDGPEPVELSTAALLGRVRAELGVAYDALTCFLPDEQVVYCVSAGAVRMTRTARRDADSAAGEGGVGLDDVAAALGIPRSKRRAKLKQARHFGRIVQGALSGAEGEPLRVLDLACGRSYLGFVLVHVLSAAGRQVILRGVDSDRVLVEKCREIARTLAWTNSSFEVADLSAYSAEPGSCDVAVSLHGCDTLTDEAIRIACEAQAPLLFVAPCCQHELRHQWKDHPLQWMSRYGLLEQGLADVLTDGFRCLVLEALGYQVKVIRFADPDVTPKNLLIQGRLTSGPRPERVRQARAFLHEFGVQPRLAALLERARPPGRDRASTPNPPRRRPPG